MREFLQNNKRPNPFKDDTPGNKWYSAFLKRHPEVSVRTPEGVTAASACVSEQDVRGWFMSTEDLLKEENVFDVLSCPSRIFNGDETNFVLCPKKDIVLAPTGCKNVYEVEKGPAKATLTVMCTFSADGKMCPPMIIYPYQRIPANVISKVPEKWGIGRSDNGWMKSEVFFEFIANVFHPYLQENNIQRPVILFVDGHKTHLTYYLSELCKELKIILISLYPNSTRILQPADVAAFRPLKSEWKNAAFTWQTNNGGKAISKEDFAPILNEMLERMDLENTIKNGFRATGLYPWNPSNIDFSKCLGRNVSNSNSISINSGNSRKSEIQPLPYDTFVRVVGEERINKFETIQNVTENAHGEDFFLLYRLWECYQNESQKEDQEVTEITTDANTSHSDENLNIPNPQHAGEEGSQSSSGRDDTEDRPTENKTPTKCINEVLLWPETPKRKGKRQVERVPFVLTSRKWNELHEEKVKMKEDNLKQKEKRKQEREEKKMQKQATEQIKKKKNMNRDIRTPTELTPQAKHLEVQTTPASTSDCMKKKEKEFRGMCFKCTRSVSSKKGYECNSCKKLFHSTCIPSGHQIHIPDDSDDDLFVCHNCYVVHDSDNADDFDDESDDFSKSVE